MSKMHKERYWTVVLERFEVAPGVEVSYLRKCVVVRELPRKPRTKGGK